MSEALMLAPELARLREEAAANEERELALVEGLSAEQLGWRPAPGRWSVAEIFVHLRVTIEQCLPALDAAIADARSRKIFGTSPFRMTRMGRLFVWYVEPPPKIRLPAPKTLRPPIDEDPRVALASLIAAHREIDERLLAANGLDLVRARFASPFASFVTMDLLALFSVYTAHERRHIYQADKVRQLIRS